MDYTRMNLFHVPNFLEIAAQTLYYKNIHISYQVICLPVLVHGILKKQQWQQPLHTFL